jgi:patatin-related protein
MRTRVDFLKRNFRAYFTARMNPAEASFIDGSVLNNKPFAQAIEAIRGRPAYRHVDRRLLYIDPHPQSTADRKLKVPGFFSTLKGALSDIPRNEPIHDDLAWVNTHNAEVRRLQMVVEGARLYIHAIAEAIAGKALDAALTGERIGEFRQLANNRARLQTGFAYEGYLRLKLTAVVEDVAAVVAEICGLARESIEAGRIITIIQRWAFLTGVSPTHQELNRAPETDLADPPPWVKFLLRFDVRYRQRRVRFVVRAVNQLYPRLAEPAFMGLKAERLDRIKAGLYDALGLLQPMTARAASTNGLSGLSRATIDTVKSVVRSIAQAMANDVALAADPDAVAEKFAKPIADALTLLGDDLALEADNPRMDALLVALVDGSDGVPLPAPARRELLEHYIGFAVWDVLTFSITNWRDLDEFDEIRVDRLSPDDAQTLRKGDAAVTLRGVKFHHFGAFFCLAYRQNDYLWGRLHAAERLIDIVLDAARIEGAGLDLDAVALKAKAFKAILDAEEEELGECRELIRTLRADVAALETRKST